MTTDESRASAPSGPARRVLVVSADIGGGHDATARALLEAAREVWPGSATGWADALDAMGRWVGPVVRRAYVINVQRTPWLYDFAYRLLWRRRGLGAACKAVVAGRAGRRLAPLIERFDPDVILTTYPLATAGLAWLRRHRGLGVPIGAWVCDYAPHPFWVYAEADATYVLDPTGARLARTAVPGASVRVSEPPAQRAFGPGDGVRDRRAFGLAPGDFVVVVAFGSYGFGHVEEAARALLEVGEPVRPVVVCGRNERLRRRLGALNDGRLVALGWVDDMPGLLRAADLVVSNAGGATSLEALVTGRPIVMYRPIAAQGKANAALMSEVGVADTCHRPADLTRWVRGRLAASDGAPHRRQAGLRLGEALRQLGAAETVAHASASARGAWPMRSSDAFFRYVSTPLVRQQIGAVMNLGPRPGGEPLRIDEVRQRVAGLVPALTALRRRPVERGRWRRLRWRVEPDVEVAAHVLERRAHRDGAGGAEAIVSGFLATALPDGRPPWQILLVSGMAGGRSVAAVKLDHALGDGLSVLGTLHRLLDEPDRPAHAALTRLTRRHPADRSRARAIALRARGLVRLGLAGPAPKARELSGPLGSSRAFRGVALASAALSGLARERGVHVAELALALGAEALHRAAWLRGGIPDALRAMLPVSLSPRFRARTFGNWTGVVAVDLPIGPMPLEERIAAVRTLLRRHLASGEPQAANMAIRAMGRFPAPAHAWMTRRVYNNAFFNLVVSHLPGPNREQHLLGAPVLAAYPVVGLAEGVRLGIGIMRMGPATGVGLLADAALAPLLDEIAMALEAGAP
jgi:UDP-N-acetylglucosamine:LPS N-acetylglucosamine transferase